MCGRYDAALPGPLSSPTTLGCPGPYLPLRRWDASDKEGIEKKAMRMSLETNGT